MRIPRALRHPLFLRSVLLAGIVLAGARVLAPVTFGFSSGDLVVRAAPAIPGGSVVLELGPFGELSWRTHRAPLDVHARFVIGPRARDLPDLDELRDLRLAFLLRKLPWLALTGALAAMLVVEGPRRRRLVAGGIGAGILVGAGALVVGATVLTFDARALEEPHYRGPIDDAPRVIALLQEVGRDVAGARRNINKVAQGLERLHEQIVRSAAASAPGPTTRVLVISDVHNNPLGLLVAQELVRRFDVRIVLNAGDFTERGTQPEGELFAAFGSLAPTQIAVGGNHEDRATLDRVRRIPGLTVLERGATDLARVDGIAVLGDTDPNGYTISADPLNEVAQAEIPQRCEDLRARWETTRATVVLVHDRRHGTCAAEAARAAGQPLVFVWGHSHKQALEVDGSLLGISPGTSGANGVKTPKESPYGFALLEFDTATGAVSSACLFAFDDPAHLGEASCRIAPLERPPG